MDFLGPHLEKDELKLDLVQRSDQEYVPRMPRGWTEGEPCENRPVWNDSLWNGEGHPKGLCLSTSCQARGGWLLYLPFQEPDSLLPEIHSEEGGCSLDSGLAPGGGWAHRVPVGVLSRSA